MNIYFKNIKLMISLVAIFAVNWSFADSLSYKQAEKYVGHVLDALMVPTLQAGYYAQEVNKLVDSISKDLLQDKNLYKHDRHNSRVYDSNRLYNKILEKVVTFIERKSRDYVHKELKNFYVPSNINKDDFAQRIAKKIRDKVVSIINSDYNLETGVLMNYVGSYLRSKVHALVKEELKYAKKSAPKSSSNKKYKTNECPVCYENFGKVKQVFLKCGHNLCDHCLPKLPKKHGNKISCPLCRAIVPAKHKSKHRHKSTYKRSYESLENTDLCYYDYYEYEPIVPLLPAPAVTAVRVEPVVPVAPKVTIVEKQYPVYVPVVKPRLARPAIAFTYPSTFSFGFDIKL